MEGGRPAEVDADAPSRRPPTNGNRRGGTTGQFAVNRDTRKPLFGTPARGSTGGGRGNARPARAGLGIQNNGRPTSSETMEAKPDRSLSTTPQGTRIPRPTAAAASTKATLSHPRRPITLMDAYRMAEEEEEKERMSSPTGPDLSPSPAPRPWLSRHESDENKMRRMLNRESSGMKGRSSRSSNKSTDSGRSGNARPESAASQHSISTTSSFDQKLDDFERSQDASPGSKGGLFSKSRIGPKVAKVGEVLARKASNSSLDGNSKSPSGSIGRSNSSKRRSGGWLKRLVSREEEVIAEDDKDDKDDQDVSIASVELVREPTPPASRPASSDDMLDLSPDKSYAWPVDAEFTAGDLQVSNSPRIRVDAYDRPPNTKLDEIRALEAEIENEFPLPDRSISRSPDPRELEIDDDPLPSRKERPRNTKLDEIRAREIEVLSKKALATSRLDEIRERNAQSRSPEELRRRGSREATPFYDAESANGRSALEGELIPNTPITVYRKTEREGTSREMSADKDQKLSRASSGSRSSSNAQDEPRDLLRRLARATSTSPQPEAMARKELSAKPPAGELNDRVKMTKVSASTATTRQGRNGRIPTPPDTKEPEPQKPTVGFVGLRRMQSTESTRTKRSSMAHSDGDPTERIEREMQLFAPMDNQSERGSIRAPSPEDTDDDKDKADEETPRPAKKVDALTMPTPRVTGAYVETPATVKPDASAPAAAANLLWNKIPGVAKARKDKVDSDPESRPTTRTRPSEPRRRRARSLPRRQQPLINTANPPTVKDDIRDLLRTHSIEDSTLDEFGELLAMQRAVSPDSPEPDYRKFKRESSTESDTKPAKGNELDFDRMTRRALMELHTAKKGIEALEDKLSHSGDALPTKDEKLASVDHSAPGHHCSSCAALPASSAVAFILIPVPRLYHRRPFRLTLLGFLLFLFAAWYTAETATCALYCRPEICTQTPCVWSPDDPTFGTALPSKLDQWTTGGQGRVVVARLSEQVEDLIADVWDFATGTDIRDVDPRTLDFYGRRQYRRRLRKKGLAKKRVEGSREDRARWDAWHEARVKSERARAAREMGYFEDEDLGFEADRRI